MWTLLMLEVINSKYYKYYKLYQSSPLAMFIVHHMIIFIIFYTLAKQEEYVYTLEFALHTSNIAYLMACYQLLSLNKHKVEAVGLTNYKCNKKLKVKQKKTKMLI